MTKGDPLDDEPLSGSLDANGPFVTHTDSSALSDEVKGQQIGCAHNVGVMS